MKPSIRFTRIVTGCGLGLAIAACISMDGSDDNFDRASVAADTQEVDIASVPSPYAFVSQLDLECRKASGDAPAPQVFLRQLNPVLQGQLPNQIATLGELKEVCLPVAKNAQVPDEDVLHFTRWVDLACYEASAEPVDVTVNLSHLNPVLAGLPEENVRLNELRRLCVPVRKNASEIPWQVKRVIRHLDLACYRFEQATNSVDKELVLSHLNPVVQEMGFVDRNVRLKRATELCVPVGKANQPIPEDVQRIIEWVDLLKYKAQWIADENPDFPLTLTHLNPLFAGILPFVTELSTPLRVLVPVAKNHQYPPTN